MRLTKASLDKQAKKTKTWHPLSRRLREGEYSKGDVLLADAAPELLEALQELTGGMWIHNVADENRRVAEMLMRAKAAITKATGK